MKSPKRYTLDTLKFHITLAIIKVSCIEALYKAWKRNNEK